MLDGYDMNTMQFESDEIKIKFLEIQTLQTNLYKIDKEIIDLSKEIDTMPKFPPNLDAWITSFSNDFKMSDFKKIFEINKRYHTLLSEREDNQKKIKMFIIDGLIDQIKEITK